MNPQQIEEISLFKVDSIIQRCLYICSNALSAQKRQFLTSIEEDQFLDCVYI